MRNWWARKRVADLTNILSQIRKRVEWLPPTRGFMACKSGRELRKEPGEAPRISLLLESATR